MKDLQKEVILVTIGVVVGSLFTVLAAMFSGERLIRMFGGLTKSDVVQIRCIGPGDTSLGYGGDEVSTGPHTGFKKQVGLHNTDDKDAAALIRWVIVPIGESYSIPPKK